MSAEMVVKLVPWCWLCLVCARGVLVENQLYRSISAWQRRLLTLPLAVKVRSVKLLPSLLVAGLLLLKLGAKIKSRVLIFAVDHPALNHLMAFGVHGGRFVRKTVVMFTYSVALLRQVAWRLINAKATWKDEFISTKQRNPYGVACILIATIV